MTETNNVKFSDNAAARLRQLQEKKGQPNLMLRLAVNGGGCSGFQYEFSFAENQKKDDHIFKNDDVSMVIDDASMAFLEGAVVDYENSLMGSFFKVENPNASSSCGCGTSFSVI